MSSLQSPYAQAMQKLAQVEANNFDDLTPLKEASELLGFAIRNDRQDPLPYVGMAYVFALLGQPQKGIPYVQKALQLEPENDMATHMMQGLIELQSNKLEIETPHILVLDTLDELLKARDFDALYEQLEEFILSEIKRLMEQPTPEIAFEEAAYEALEQAQNEVQLIFAKIQSLISSLDAEMSCLALYERLKPLQVIVKRYTQAFEHSHRFQYIAIEINECNAMISESMRQFARSEADFVKNTNPYFNPIYDLSDKVADQLDELESIGVQIGPILYYYERMLHYFQAFQDRIEDSVFL